MNSRINKAILIVLLTLTSACGVLPNDSQDVALEKEITLSLAAYLAPSKARLYGWTEKETLEILSRYVSRSLAKGESAGSAKLRNYLGHVKYMELHYWGGLPEAERRVQAMFDQLENCHTRLGGSLDSVSRYLVDQCERIFRKEERSLRLDKFGSIAALAGDYAQRYNWSTVDTLELSSWYNLDTLSTGLTSEEIISWLLPEFLALIKYIDIHIEGGLREAFMWLSNHPTQIEDCAMRTGNLPAPTDELYQCIRMYTRM